MLEFFIIIFTILINILVGLFVLIRNPKQVVNQLFALLTATQVMFTIVDYFSLGLYHKLLFIKLVLLFSMIASMLLYFVVYFMHNNKKISSKHLFGILFTFITSLLLFTPFVVKGLSNSPQYLPVPNYGIIFFILQFVIFLIGTLKILLNRAKKFNSKERSQNIYLAIGVIPIIFIAPITGFIMPIMFHNDSLIGFSPIYTMFLISMVGFSIIKYQLFDIKSYAIKAFAYIMTILILSLVYIAPIIYFITYYILNISFNLTHYLVEILIVTLSSFLYVMLFGIFNKYTNKLFFRKNYNPEKFIAEFNKVVATNFILEELLSNVSNVIVNNVKASYCTIIIKESSQDKMINISSSTNNINIEKLKNLPLLTKKISERIIVTDALDSRSIILKKLLLENNILLLMRIIDTSVIKKRNTQPEIGYIFLGAKKGGNLYNKQDVEVLEMLLDGLFVAIQNALRLKEIQYFNLTLQSKVEEATRKLRITNEKLKIMDETKDDFISMASHQLRTPLTSIKGYISMVLEEDAGKVTPLQRQMLSQAFFSSQRMVYLIADLLNVSRLKSGKFVIESTQVNLASMVTQELEQLRDTAKIRSINLQYNEPKDFPDFMLDETKLRQVIMNFVDNALYYTPTGGRIDVKVIDNPTTIEFRVEDNGIGVPKSEQPHLFTKFYRAANARKARPDGTGLGLYMAKKVVIAQGGSIIFKSQEGVGSTFGFIFSKRAIAIRENQSSNTYPKKYEYNSKTILTK